MFTPHIDHIKTGQAVNILPGFANPKNVYTFTPVYTGMLCGVNALKCTPGKGLLIFVYTFTPLFYIQLKMYLKLV